MPVRRTFRVVNGGTPTSDPANWDGGIQWATPVDIGKVNGGLLVETERTLSSSGLASGSRVVPKDSLIVSTRAPIGYVAQTTDSTAFNQGCRGLVLSGEGDIRYFRYVFASVAEQLNALGQGSTFVELSSDSLLNIQIPVPTFSVQRAIADFLDRELHVLDALVADEKQRLRLADELRIAFAQSRVLGREDGGKVIDDPLGPLLPVPDGWTLRRNKTFMREVIELSTSGDEELLTVSHLTGVTPRSEKDVTMFLADTNEGYKRVRAGDLVVNTMWAWMGALGVAKCDGIVSPAYGVYRFTDSDAEPRYFDELFRSPAYVSEMTRFSKGVWTSRLRLYPDSFLALRSPFPPLAVQREVADEIVTRLQKSRNLNELLTESVGLLNERRQALITAAVTGQLDIPEVAA